MSFAIEESHLNIEGILRRWLSLKKGLNQKSNKTDRTLRTDLCVYSAITLDCPFINIH